MTSKTRIYPLVKNEDGTYRIPNTGDLITKWVFKTRINDTTFRKISHVNLSVNGYDLGNYPGEIDITKLRNAKKNGTSAKDSNLDSIFIRGQFDAVKLAKENKVEVPTFETL